MSGGLAVAFPGTGFTTKEVLFQQCISVYDKKGYQIIELDFSMIPFKTIETVDEAVEEANKQTVIQLENIIFEEYEDVVFISKSLGTVCAGWLEHQLNICPRQLYLTPIPETFTYIDGNSKVIALVLGTIDKLMSADRLTAFCIPNQIHYLIVKGVGHNLKDDDSKERTELINKEISSLCK